MSTHVPPETEIVDRVHVVCDGSGDALGHPRIYMQIDESIGFVECGYCDKKFVLRGFEEGGAGKVGSNASVGDAPGDRTDGESLDERA